MSFFSSSPPAATGDPGDRRRRRSRTRVAVGVTGALVASGAILAVPAAQAGPTNVLKVAAAKSRTCADGPARGAGVDSYTVTAPTSGLVEAAVTGSGDWDLAVFDDVGDVVAASAGFGGREKATGFVDAGTELTVQGCLLKGKGASVTVDLTFLEIVGEPETSSLVSVETPTREDKERLQSLDLDLTEHGTQTSIDVVLHGEADAAALTGAGFDYDVEIADLGAQSAADRRADARFAAANATSGLPSGRTEYRRLADYEAELKQLVAQYPALVRPITLAERTVEGREVHGIEITTDVNRVHDGKPVFLHMGLHHAREWPSGEHAMEWAYDLLKGYGTDAEITDLVRTTRTIVVPVVNPDGFTISREATTTNTFGTFSYDNKRKNCSISAVTPESFRTGTCAANNAGRLRGTDLNRNYGGLWGGPGASTSWSSDTYRGDAPFSEPESRNVQALIAERSVTTLITNHTYSNLWLRPPGVAALGAPLEEPIYKALGERATSHNNYANIPSYELYDTTGGTEDWAFWTAGSIGFTPEIGDENFHPAFERAVVAEYLGLAPAAGAGLGGNRAAYLEMQRATADPAYHSRLTGTMPAGWSLEVSKQFLTSTSPVVQPNGSTTAPLTFEDRLSSRYESTGGKFTFAVNPSTRPIVAGRDGREPTAPPQPGATLANPPGVPAANPQLSLSGPYETTTFTIEEGYDNAFADLRFTWGSANVADWDFYVFDSAGQVVGSAATGGQPELITLRDPLPGTYTVVVFNYAGGANDDWSGSIAYRNPTPRVVNPPESWTLTCRDHRDRVKSVREVVVERGETVDLANVCVPRSRAGGRD